MTANKNHCNAVAKSTGNPCKRPAGWGTGHPGTGRCKLHGGKSLGGIASPTYKTGKYSRYLPDKLANRYEMAVNDPGLLELNHEIALLDSRLASLLERIDTGEAGLLWQNMAKLWTELTTAIKQQDKTKQQDIAIKLDMLIKQGHDDYLAWNEIQNVIEHRRKLVESERKRLIETQQYVTAVQAMTMIGSILAIIKENVTDRNTLQAISQGINHLVSREDAIDAS